MEKDNNHWAPDAGPGKHKPPRVPWLGKPEVLIEGKPKVLTEGSAEEPVDLEKKGKSKGMPTRKIFTRIAGIAIVVGGSILGWEAAHKGHLGNRILSPDTNFWIENHDEDNKEVELIYLLEGGDGAKYFCNDLANALNTYNKDTWNKINPYNRRTWGHSEATVFLYAFNQLMNDITSENALPSKQGGRILNEVGFQRINILVDKYGGNYKDDRKETLLRYKNFISQNKLEKSLPEATLKMYFNMPLEKGGLGYSNFETGIIFDTWNAYRGQWETAFSPDLVKKVNDYNKANRYFQFIPSR